MRIDQNKLVKIGEIGVDAGLCWVGDPCYVLHTDEKPKDIGLNWHSFCDILSQKNIGEKLGAQFNYDMGHPGLGVAVHTGWGDGCYDVFAEIEDFGAEGGPRVKRIIVEFIPDEVESIDYEQCPDEV
jgi:hypothetical protein